MAKQAPSLPLYNSKKADVKVLHIHAGEPDESVMQRYKRVLLEFYRKLTTASTGRPSDGLKASSVGSAPSAFASAPYQFKEKADGVEWVIDETFVSGEVMPSGGDDASFKGSAQSPEFYTNVAGQAPSHIASTFRPLQMEYWTLIVKYFFNPAFEEKQDEISYQKEKWYGQKQWTAAASLFLMVNWILYLALNRDSTQTSLYAQIVYYGGLSLFTAPLIPMVYANMPVEHPVIFQIWFVCAVWYCGITEIIQIKKCGYYSEAATADADTCGGKDFLAMMYYITALPALMMFVISRRVYNFILQVITFILLMALVIPDQGIFARNVISFILFSILIQMVHFGHEITERRIFLMTSRVKFAYKQLQKAQLAESQASDAKNRFASYIFHEVRVPLNVVKLAFDHVKTHVTDPDVDQEIYAMDAGLNMMEKVLNDALDLNKMDRGHFENANKPFPIQRVMQSALEPIRLACNAKQAHLEYTPDPRVNMIFEDMQINGALWVMGDELRLRQVLTNLASNAVKFCPERTGQVNIKTTLISPLPGTPPPKTPEEELPDFWRREMRKMTIRIEFEDNGPGVTSEDLRENRLFRPFVQAAAGKKKTGTGLGLAIVRQIVSLSGGKLGLVSHSTGGANFWVEMQYEIATAEDMEKLRDEDKLKATPLVALDVMQSTTVMMNITMPDKEPTFYPFPSPSTPDTETVIGSPYFSPPPGLKRAVSSFAAAAEPEHEEKRVPLRPDWKVGEVKEGALMVLVVDDDPLTRRVMMRTLSRSGCYVEAAEDGQHFLDIITDPESKPYDLITLDNHMPIMTGEEAIRKLRSEKLGCLDYYVVGCTGNAVSTDRDRFLSSGVNDVLPKPLDRRKLDTLLQEAERRKSARSSSSTGSQSDGQIHEAIDASSSSSSS